MFNIRAPQLIFFSLLSLASTEVQAASTLADIKAKLGEKTDEINEVDQLLASEDKNARIAAMELLLQSGNPVFVKRAKDVGLFSSDIELRTAALRATFEGGGPFQIQLELNGDGEKSKAIEWLQQNKGSWTQDGNIGTYSFYVKPYNDEYKCWENPHSSASCMIYLSGETISLGSGFGGASGSLSLGGEGKLSGNFVPPYGVPVQAEIDLSK